MMTWAERVMVAEAVDCGHLGGCGCDAFQGCCVNCPLPEYACDSPLSYLRNVQMRELKQRGIPVQDIADQFSMSKRNTFRILAGSDILT